MSKDFIFGVKDAEITQVHRARTVDEVVAAISNLQQRQGTLTKQLEAAIISNGSIASQLARLDLSRARIGSVAVAARSIGRNMLGEASSTARGISEAVEQLDLEKDRVKATLVVVEQVVELKACVLGVVGSMGASRDWETAAEYMDRASKIPQDVVDCGFATATVPTAEVPDTPRVTLDAASQSLAQIFLREFDAAVEEGDGTSITRFFKMFPLIGRSQEGIDAYAKYVCHGVTSRARVNLQAASASAGQDKLSYAKALTKLFEHIAQVIDSHTPLVERHYGAGTMAKVIQRLHGEADVQGGIILDTWSDERSIDRKLTDVKSYAFSFLVQSFLASPSDNSSSTRAQSPTPTGPADDSVDLRNVDQTLNEISAMLMPWSLYTRFISSRSGGLDIEDEHPKVAAKLMIPKYFQESNLPKKILKVLLEPFNAFATFFLRRSVERAFQLDEFPQGLSLNPSKTLLANPPYITSAVDDVMYIVNQILQRSLATSQTIVILALIAMMSRVLNSDFIGMIQRKMLDESYPKAVIQGTMPPEDKIVSFIILTNNVDISNDYMKRIIHSHNEETVVQAAEASGDVRTPLQSLFPLGNDAAMVRKSLSALENTFSSKANDLNSDALTVLFSQVVKLRIRPILADAFRDAEYSVADSSISIQRSGDFEEEGMDTLSVKVRIHTGWEALMGPLRRLLTERNMEKLLGLTTTYLSNVLEKRIWSYSGRITEFGAVNLERDVVEIANVVVKGQNFKSRGIFNRCLQIMTIMNMEHEEWESILSTEHEQNMRWMLDSDERDRARQMVALRA